MKKSMLMTMSVLMALSASTALAAPLRVQEVRTNFERSIREGQRALETGNKETIRQDLTKDLSAMTGGRVNTREMSAALNKTFELNEGGAKVEVNMVQIAKALKDAKEVTSQINRNELDAQAKDLMTQKDRAMEIVPKFMALASSVSKAGANATKQKEVDAFVKQMSLIKESLSTMDIAELKSHLDVMEIAIENKLRNPELEGDQAYAQALKAKFGDKYAQKLEEILGCARQ